MTTDEKLCYRKRTARRYASAVCARHGTGSLGHRVNGSSFTRPGHRVIILTRCETRVFPVFEKMLKMQKVHLKCWNDKSHCLVSVVARLKSLDVSRCNKLLLLPVIIKNSLAREYFFATSMIRTPLHISRHLEFIIERGHRVAGFPGLWVAGSQNVTQFHVWYVPCPVSVCFCVCHMREFCQIG